MLDMYKCSEVNVCELAEMFATSYWMLLNISKHYSRPLKAEPWCNSQKITLFGGKLSVYWTIYWIKQIGKKNHII